MKNIEIFADLVKKMHKHKDYSIIKYNFNPSQVVFKYKNRTFVIAHNLKPTVDVIIVGHENPSRMHKYMATNSNLTNFKNTLDNMLKNIKI